MNNKSLYSILAIIIIVIVAAVVYMQSGKQTSEQANMESINPTQTETSQSNAQSELATNSDTATADPNSTTGTFSGETDVTNVDVAVHEIVFSGTAFTPKSLEINNGDVVVFKNDSDKSFWPASAPHPQHTDYPEFDPKKSIATGGSWEFKFTKTGTWKFHDHLTPSAFGSITVK